MDFTDKLADLLRQGADKIINLPSEAQRFVTNPQAFTQAITGQNPLPKEAGFSAGVQGLPPMNPEQGGVLNPKSAPYTEGYESAEPVAIAGMALPAYAGALRAGAPKAYNALENYMVKSGGMIPLEAYHGTPHNIQGKFDISKVGTGEGAQAYGHGMYFAENPSVAKEYQKLDPAGGPTLPTRRILNGQELEAGTPEYHAGTLLSRNGVTLKDARNMVKSWIDDPAAMSAGENTVEGWKKTLDTLNGISKKSAFKELPHEGNLYKVDIPDEHIPNMLDWDKPVSQQSKPVMEKMVELGFSKDLTGKQAYNFAKEMLQMDMAKTPTPKDISEFFNKNGIKGVRYLDEGSRSTGKGTSNFVVFDPSDVKILEKNSQPVSRKELLEQQVNQLEKTNLLKTNPVDVSETFGAGAKKLQYKDPNSEGIINLLIKPDGTASVLGLEVPEKFRGKGIGQRLQEQAMNDYPQLQGQVSSKAAAKTAYKLGRRPVGEPNATLDDVFKAIDENSSVNLITPKMQQTYNK